MDLVPAPRVYAFHVVYDDAREIIVEAPSIATAAAFADDTWPANVTRVELLAFHSFAKDRVFSTTNFATRPKFVNDGTVKP